MEYNTPNSRERIEARRKSRKGDRTAIEPGFERVRPKTPRVRGATRPATAPVAITSLMTSVQQRMRRTSAARTSTMRATGNRRRTREGGSRVQAGAQRTLSDWLRSGRLVSLILFLGVVGTLFSMFQSPSYQVAQIVVEGNSALAADAIADLSNLRGTSIWFVEQAAVIERLQTSPYIERASIELGLPDHATIRVVERRPEVRWQLGSVQYLVDSTGKVLALAPDPVEPGVALQAVAEGKAQGAYLVIVDSSKHQLAPNDQVDPDALTLAHTLVLRLHTDLNFTPTLIGWDFGLGIYVISPAGQTIVFGQSSELERKLALLDYLFKQKTAFTYLDLRPATPFYQNTVP